MALSQGRRAAAGLATVWHARRGAGYLPRMARLLAAAPGVRAFLGGHIHTLEQLSLADLDVFVSGSTAMGGWPTDFHAFWPAAAQVRFAMTAWGFAELEVAAGRYRLRFLDDRGDPLHCCEAGAEGPCRPVECR
jgi:hypothetical protein